MLVSCNSITPGAVQLLLGITILYQITLNKCETLHGCYIVSVKNKLIIAAKLLNKRCLPHFIGFHCIGKIKQILGCEHTSIHAGALLDIVEHVPLIALKQR